MPNKIIRTICAFTDSPSPDTIDHLNKLKAKFEAAGFIVQTIRISTNQHNFELMRQRLADNDIRLSIGSLDLATAEKILPAFHQSHNINFNLELSQTRIDESHVDLLFAIIKNNAANTFNFTYLFNGVPTPYFPSAIYRENGFAIGLQSTDLADNCQTLQAWLDSLKITWSEITDIMASEPEFLGIDSSIAPLFNGKSSLLNFIKKLGYTFPESTTTNLYTTMSNWIKQENPRPYGLNGLMLPCLEDFELADEYENGEFTIERNIYLSLHSGLGIDTYPMGIDEDPKRILGILQLMQALSNKYKKPLSVRFVSDGKAKIGASTQFNNQYLKDVVIRKI